MLKLHLVIVFLALSLCSLAQGYSDGFLKGKGNHDLAFTYSYEHYDTYYFGREKQDISTTTQSFSLYGTGGLSNRLDYIVSIPYLRTDSLNSALQDGIVALKYRNKQWQSTGGNWDLLTSVGLSFPLSNYPTTTERPIGIKSTSFLVRFILQNMANNGVFWHVQTGLDVRFIPSTQTGIPLIFRTGFAGRHFYVDVWVDYFTSLEAGVDNQVAGGSGSTWLKTGGTFYKPLGNRAGLFVGGAYHLSGQNIGKSWRVNGGGVLRL